MRFLITGTLGIGKSIFLYYILWRLSTSFDLDNKNSQIWKGKKIFIQSDSHKILYLKENQVIVYSLFDASKILDYNSLLLVDMVESQEPLFNPGITIIFASPNPARYKQFIKDVMTAVLYMKVWTKKELELVWKKNYKSVVTNEDFINVYDKCGGVIRYVLEQNSIALTQLDEAFEKVRDRGRSIVNFFDSIVAKDDESFCMIFHLRQNSSDYLQSKLQFSSPYVIACISNIILQEDLDNLMRYVNSNDYLYIQTSCERIFKHLFHKLYLQIDIRDLRRLTFNQSKLNETEKLSWDKEQQQYGIKLISFKIEMITFENNNPVEFDIYNIDKIRNNIYYKPRSQTLSSIDSFVKNDNNVFLFLITITTTHPIIEEGLLQVLELFERIFPNQKLIYHLIFVCPKGTENSLKFKTQKIIENSCINKNKNVMEYQNKLKSFLFKQWIAEVEITDSLISNSISSYYLL